MNKKQKIEVLQNLINGKITVSELMNTLPKPIAIEWGEDDPFNVYLVNHKLSTKTEFIKANNLRAKYG